MSTNKHTPGPWRYVGHFGTHCLDSNGRCIADAPHPNGMSEEEGFANARLIAAAPELLEALEYLAGFEKNADWDGYKAVTMAKSAIAKARGAL